MNPRQIVCTIACYDNFNADIAPNFVPTDMIFLDRFQGQIPSDATMVMLTGDDALPEMAIGRLPARSETEMRDMVDKVIQYEANIAAPQAWMENILFVADDADSAGNFCAENAAVGGLLPSSLNQTHLCLPTAPTQIQKDALRAQMFDSINVAGTLIMNYRGHGSIDNWASSAIMTSADAGTWTEQQPTANVAQCRLP